MLLEDLGFVRSMGGLKEEEEEEEEERRKREGL